MGIYLIADPHLGHEKVARIRGFSSSTEHDAWFFRNWEKAVSEGDTVYVLGDLVFGMHKYELLEQLGSLPGTKYLISGNHDRCHPSMPGVCISGRCTGYSEVSWDSGRTSGGV